MSTLGFVDVVRSAVFLEFGKEETVPVASPAAQFVLKLFSWFAEPHRKHDAEDIAFIMEKYLDAGNYDRLYAEHTDLIDPEFALASTGAALLRRDIESSFREGVVVGLKSQLGEELSQEGSQLISQMSKGNMGFKERYLHFEGMLRVVAGMNEGSV